MKGCAVILMSFKIYDLQLKVLNYEVCKDEFKHDLQY